MTSRGTQAPGTRAGSDIDEPQYEATGRLRPRQWPVGPNESYGKVEFDDGEGHPVLTSTFSGHPNKVTSCTSSIWPRRCDWTVHSFA